MKIGRLKITASRWPWQKRDRHWSHTVGGAKPGLTWGWGRVPGMARFGGGWDWKLGVSIGGREIIADLLLGSVRVTLEAPKP